MSSVKILPLEELGRKTRALRDSGKRVVMCHGTFDLIHNGHIRHLQRARAEGDVLVVTLTADAYVNKGPGRPVFGEEQRAEMMAALACVDYVAINHSVAAMPAIEHVRPHLYVKGSDYKAASDDVTGNIDRERLAVEAVGGQVFYTDEITFSSSSLLNEHFDVFSSETKEYLRAFRQKYSYRDIIGSLKGLVGLRVAVVGDAIIDQYHYIQVLGQMGKGNSLAVSYESEEEFAGGAMAVANHLAGFAEHVTLVTALGERNSREDFVRARLRPNVTPQFFHIEGAHTLTKRRFVDSDLNKLFEVYFGHGHLMSGAAEQSVVAWLGQNLRNFDVVVVPDFGNGFLSANMIDTLCAEAKFLAVNTQLNSGNRGHHVIGRYQRADFVSINEPELRLATHNRHDPIEALAEVVGQRTTACHVAITCGSKGVMVRDRTQDVVHHVPALSTRVLDRVGAGDAFLALAGLCLGGGLESDVAAFVGSASAALDVQIVGNRESIDSARLFKYITTLLK